MTDLTTDRSLARSGDDAWPMLFAAWLIAFAASLAVLFIGEILGQTPCNLCWFQRGFMFPLAIVLAVAVWRSDAGVWRYGLPLAIGGALVAAFHTLVYAGIIPEAIRPCTATGPSCSGSNMAIFGMPLPLLALIAFLAIAACLLAAKGRTP